MIDGQCALWSAVTDLPQNNQAIIFPLLLLYV